MRRILDSIDAELATGGCALGCGSRRVRGAHRGGASQELLRRIRRWRQLYQGARAQLLEANRHSEMHGLSAKERREAKIQQAQANEQLALLERGTASGGSDFYTYRYLATEGFLPGYNFPRCRFTPMSGRNRAGGPRPPICNALASSPSRSSAPRSLIYHEGRAYRVYKAKLPPGVRD